jgi:integrase
MGLGPLRLFGLSDARDKAADAQRLLHEGKDPIEFRRDARAKARLEAAKSITFKKAAETYIASHSSGWRGAKVKGQWEATLRDYAYPVIGSLPVQAVDTALVLKVLEPIWTKKPETAGRVRQRIEAILDWAKVREYRDGLNPARWKGHLDVQLPPRGKVRKVEHHAALPYSEVGDFMARLRQHVGTAARAFEFAILTAARTNETLGALWSEIDFGAKTWTVPAERMKADKEHRVPLSRRAIGILEEMSKRRPTGNSGAAYVFPGQRSGKPLSNMAFLMLLRRMQRPDLTAHGFRSTFRDWVAEHTTFPNEVAEMALAHVVADKVEAAYRRGNLFEKRRQLMDAWAEWCEIGVAGAGESVRQRHAVAVRT